MALDYGALKGKFDRAVREDDPRSPHLQIRLLAGETPWRIAINVQSQDTSQVVYWIANPITNHPIVNTARGLPTGFTRVQKDGAHALDFSQAPLFAFGDGLRLPPIGQANNDDLQDLLLLHLNQLKTAGGDLIAFGAKFGDNRHLPIDQEFGNTTGLNGVHDIHMNQGNPKGKYSADNGPFHDGGLLLAFPDRTVGIFLAFQTQEVPTDLSGNPKPGSVPLSDLLSRVDPDRPIDTAQEGIYLERALINPAGDDAGKETIVVGNLTTGEVDLSGWSVKDTNNRTTPLSGTIAAGASLVVELDGTGVQLGNKRGNLLLLDAQGDRVHAVTYDAADGRVQGRYVRF